MIQIFHLLYDAVGEFRFRWIKTKEMTQIGTDEKEISEDPSAPYHLRSIEFANKVKVAWKHDVF